MELKNHLAIFVLFWIAIHINGEDEDGGFTCLEPWTQRQDRCYAYIDLSYSYSYEDAQSACLIYGAQLYVPNSDSEYEYVAAYIASNLLNFNYVWIGCDEKGTDGVFECVDGTQLDSTSDWWSANEPEAGNGQKCADMYVGTLRLLDSGCSDQDNVLCEAPAIPVTSTSGPTTHEQTTTSSTTTSTTLTTSVAPLIITSTSPITMAKSTNGTTTNTVTTPTTTDPATTAPSTTTTTTTGPTATPFATTTTTDSVTTATPTDPATTTASTTDSVTTATTTDSVPTTTTIDPDTITTIDPDINTSFTTATTTDSFTTATATDSVTTAITTDSVRITTTTTDPNTITTIDPDTTTIDPDTTTTDPTTNTPFTMATTTDSVTTTTTADAATSTESVTTSTTTADSVTTTTNTTTTSTTSSTPDYGAFRRRSALFTLSEGLDGSPLLGYCLVGHILEQHEMERTSKIQCAGICLTLKDCRSFNIRGKVCSLNTKQKREVHASYFVVRSGCQYYDRSS